jgi:hypothetical protein
MSEIRIAPGATHVFAAGQLEEVLELENRHNVNGVVQYQIGARAWVNINMAPNMEFQIQGINGQQLSVVNGLSNSLYCRWG